MYVDTAFKSLDRWDFLIFQCWLFFSYLFFFFNLTTYFSKILERERVCVYIYIYVKTHKPRPSLQRPPRKAWGRDNPRRVPPPVHIIETGRRGDLCQMSIPRPYSVIPVLLQPQADRSLDLKGGSIPSGVLSLPRVFLISLTLNRFLQYRSLLSGQAFTKDFVCLWE